MSNSSDVSQSNVGGINTLPRFRALACQTIVRPVTEDIMSRAELQPNPAGIRLGPLWLQPGISPRNALTAYISSAAFGMRTDMKLSMAPKPSGSDN